MKTEIIKNKKKFLREFQKLETLSEKFEFWEKKLERNYILLTDNSLHALPPEMVNELQALQDFIIKPEQAEFREYNKLLLQTYEESIGGNLSNKVYKLEVLIDGFESDFKSVANKREFINQEINRIDKLVSDQENIKKKNVFDTSGKFFVHGFNESYLNNREPDLYTRIYDIHNLIALLNGNITGKYKKHLDEQLNRLNKKTKTASKSEISIRQQLIILDYLGVLEQLEKVENNTQKAEFLSLLLNKSSQNIRKELSNIRNLKTLPDLELVAKLFETISLKPALKKIKQDMREIE